MYTFRTVLDAMNTGQPFTCELITYDENRRSGGLHRTIQAQVLPKSKEGRSLTKNEERRRKAGKRHVRRIQLLVDGHPVDQIRAIHIPLIIKFNGETVVP